MKTDRPIKEFLAEAEDILETANQTVLAIEGEQGSGSINPDLVNALFRAVHSFKGLAGMFGFHEPSELAHKLESLLDELRLGKLSFDQSIIGAILDTLGLLGRLVQQTAKKQPFDDTTEAQGRIAALLKSASGSADRSLLAQVNLEPGILQVLTEYEEHRLKENIREHRHLFTIKAVFELTDFESGIKRLNRELKKVGEIICTLPTSSAAGSGISFTIVVGTGESHDALQAAVKDRNIAVAAVAYLEARKPSEAAAASAASLKSVSNTVRVDIYKLDYLMNIIGELHLTKSIIGRMTRDLRAVPGCSGFSSDLTKVQRALERRLNDLQEGILDVRMVPLGQIFTRLAQVVKRYASEARKDIDISLYGEETELDKLMIEDLADPLMHLVRNAVDHGIEPPDLRKQRGKPEQGMVRLSAAPKGNHVMISVEDDGAGIDPRIILSKAREKGLVAQDISLDPDIDRKEILDFIFVPGFTTSSTVTEISGRGVGMDVVKKNISKLSGMIDIETEAGVGTKFILTLPITLAIIKALVIEAGGRLFAIPLSSVLEIFRATPSQMETVENREVMAIRDDTIPLLRLSQAFNLPTTKKQDLFYVILVGLAERRLGIVVDSLRDQQEIVIKPLGKRLSGTPGIAGATELGDRRGVVLVLDVESLIEGALRRTAQETKI